jgi:hypothetical protein
VQDALRRTAPNAGLYLLDLPKRFEEYTCGLPDRRLFLDYCHLTSEGIRVAMGSAAEFILPLFDEGSRTTWRDLCGAVTGPSPEVEGDARLLAAIHCAKLGQRFDIVRHHCLKAVEASPRLVDALASVLDFQTRKTPNLLCASFEHLLRTSTPSAARYLLTHGCESKEEHKPLRRGFTKAALSVVDEFDRSIGPRIGALTREIHGVTSDGVDLLQLAYSEEGLCSESQPADFHRSSSVESHFVFFCREQTAVEFRFTCRLPEGPGDVSIVVNGVPIGSVHAAERWAAFRLSVPQEATAAGANTLDLRWPVPPSLGDGGLERLGTSLDQGLIPEMSPVLGELHAFGVYAAA